MQELNNKLCPKCGAKMEGPCEFCTNCGYSKDDPENDIGRHAAFKAFPIVIYCLFAYLLFAFLAAPTYVSGMNVYDIINIANSNDVSVPAEITCLIALSTIATVMTIPYIILHFVMKDEKQKLKLHRAFMIYSICMLISLLVTSAVIVGTNGAATACPVIILVLTCLLILINVFCFFAEIGSDKSTK